MKLKALEISAELLFEMFTDGHHPAGYTVIKDAIPADARLVKVEAGWLSQTGELANILLLIESESFEDVTDGKFPPTLNPYIRRDDPIKPAEGTA